MVERRRMGVSRWRQGVLSSAIVIAGMIGIVLFRPPKIAQSEDQVIYLLPVGFTGPFIILYNQANGAAPLHEGKARLYHIPSSGLLRTQFSPWEGGLSPIVYYVDSGGHRTSIPVGEPWNSALPPNRFQLCDVSGTYRQRKIVDTPYEGGTIAVDSARPGPMDAYAAYAVAQGVDCQTFAANVDRLLDSMVRGTHSEAQFTH